MLKLGTAAPWFTALESAERSAPEAEPLDDGDGPVPVTWLGLVEAEELELELELDEQAASMSAAAVIASADATRLAREARGARAAPPPRLKPYR